MVYVGKTQRMVNSFTTGGQMDSEVARLANGSFVIAWSYTELGTSQDAYQRRFYSSGEPIATDSQVNTYTADTQFVSSVAGLTNGNYLVAWSSYGEDGSDFGVYLQEYNQSGVKVGNAFRANTTTEGNQSGAVVTGLYDGGYVVVWHTPIDHDGASDFGLYRQQYDALGQKVGGERLVNTVVEGQQSDPAVAALKGSGYVVAWENAVGTGDTDISFQRFSETGKALGDETRVNTTTTGFQGDVNIAGLDNGGFIVVWDSHGHDSDGHDIYLQRYNAKGQAVDSETIVNTSSEGAQAHADIAVLSDGSYVVTWDSLTNGKWNVFYQMFSAEGAKIGDETRVNSETSLNSYYSQVEALNDRKFVVTWTAVDPNDAVWAHSDSYDLYERVFSYENARPQTRDDKGTMLEHATGVFDVLANDKDADGETLSVKSVDVMIGSATATVLKDNTISVKYTGENLDPGETAKLTIAYSATDGIRPSTSFLIVTVNGVAEDIVGTRKDDILTGTKFGESIYGKIGRDTIKAGAGDDFLFGGQGKDTLYGGSGVDTFVYEKGLALESDVIKDFVATGDNHDIIRIEGYFTNFNRLRLVDLGSSTRIDFAGNNSIYVTGVKPADLDAGDFLFV